MGSNIIYSSVCGLAGFFTPPLGGSWWLWLVLCGFMWFLVVQVTIDGFWWFLVVLGGVRWLLVVLAGS